MRKKAIPFFIKKGFSVNKFEIAKINKAVPVTHKPAYQKTFFIVG